MTKGRGKNGGVAMGRNTFLKCPISRQKSQSLRERVNQASALNCPIAHEKYKKQKQKKKRIVRQ